MLAAPSHTMIIDPQRDATERNAWIAAFRSVLDKAQRDLERAHKAQERARTPEAWQRAKQQADAALGLVLRLSPLASLREVEVPEGGEHVDLRRLAQWLHDRAGHGRMGQVFRPEEIARQLQEHGGHWVGHSRWPDSYDREILSVHVAAPPHTGEGSLCVLHWRQHTSGALHQDACGPSAYTTPAPWRVRLTLEWWRAHGPAMRSVCGGHLERCLREAEDHCRRERGYLWSHPDYATYLELLQAVRDVVLT